MEKVYPSPAIANNLKGKMDLDDVWHLIEKEGCKGFYPTPNGCVVEYEYDPSTKSVKARLRVNEQVERDILEDAKICRETENTGTAMHGVNGGMFKLSPRLDVELRARGLDPMVEGDIDMWNKILRVVESEFPLYKTTNRKLA